MNEQSKLENGTDVGAPVERVVGPRRIQRRRTKGWRMPPGTVFVGRPTKWGNPFVVVPTEQELTFAGYGNALGAYLSVKTASDAVEQYKRFLKMDEIGRKVAHDALNDLRGRNLACWCKEGDPCHADVLLELANS